MDCEKTGADINCDRKKKQIEKKIKNLPEFLFLPFNNSLIWTSGKIARITKWFSYEFRFYLN